ncbi:MAG: diaminopimelate decarboxylase [Muribaculaceae bacterium]|nr:diaminopimelate decarboxylase [Muribaculaceae bacterium]
MTNFPLEEFKALRTPFYYYDIELLRKTLDEINIHSNYDNYHVHYAIKANVNAVILEEIRKAGLGVDCVSGGEIEAALNAGFDAQKIVFAGVGKSDWEIELGLQHNIACFNVESIEELSVINSIAHKMGKTARVALRVNPNIDAHTHHYITTGLAENKFGINLEALDNVIDLALNMENIKLQGLHFHIGSQITINEPFKILCDKINELTAKYAAKGVTFKTINVGGGLGIDYENPSQNPIPDFKGYFNTFHENIKLGDNQELHFELGRSVVGQCGSLISRVLYVKHGTSKKFAIIDAGFTELIRPALYQAHHAITPIAPRVDAPLTKYDVVGPICESSDCFGEDELLPQLERGDFIAIQSAGAYGEIMASQYNCRRLPMSIYKR